MCPGNNLVDGPTHLVIWAAQTGLNGDSTNQKWGWAGELGVDLEGVTGRSWGEHYNTLNAILK